MQRVKKNREAGFSLIESLIAMSIGLVLIGAALSLFSNSVKISNAVSLQADMQQTARAGLNLIAEDLSIAGTNFVRGGVQLPFGSGVTSPAFGYDMAGNLYFTKLVGVIDPTMSATVPNARLYPITPANALIRLSGSGIYTDAVMLVYQDPKLPLSNYPLETVNDTSVSIYTADPVYLAAVTGDAVRMQAGDVIVVHNANGDAAALVTAVSGGGQTFSFNDGDPLHFNQSTAPAGRVSLLKHAADGTHAAPYYPSDTTAYRILIITYYVDKDTKRLMRQINAHTPTMVADNIANLKLTYDLYDDANQQVSVNSPNANNVPNQIRKVSLILTVYGDPAKSVNGRAGYMSLTTSVSVRNMAFRDRYS